MQPLAMLHGILLLLSIVFAAPLQSKAVHSDFKIGGSDELDDVQPFLWQSAYPEPGKARTYKAVVFKDAIEDTSTTVQQKALELDILDFHTPTALPSNLDPQLLKTPKYFEERTSNPHVAAGFEPTQENTGRSKSISAATRQTLQHLARNLTEFAIAHDWVYWLAHGTLLGESWGSKTLSFDDDLDVQTSYLGLYKMLPHHNVLYNERYLLQINPWFVQRMSLNNIRFANTESTILPRMREKNVIDARFLDVKTGLFVDITALSAEAADDAWYDSEDGRLLAGEDENLHDKSVHTYKFTDISPLHYCEFEGLPAWCPHNSEQLLIKEYQYTSKNPHYQTFRYNTSKKDFEELDCTALAKLYTNPTAETCDAACRHVVKHERQIHWAKDGHAPDECLLNVRVKKLLGEGIELYEDFSFLGRRTTENFPNLP